MGKLRGKKQAPDEGVVTGVPAEPKKKGKPLLGGLGGFLGRGNKAAAQSTDEEVVTYYEEGTGNVPPPMTRTPFRRPGRGGAVQEGMGSSMPGQTEGSVQMPSGQGGVAGAGKARVMARAAVQAPQVVEQTSRPVMSNAAAKANYGEQRMENTVLLYSGSRYFASIQQAFNLREGVACAGVSDPNMLLQAYRQQPVYNFIVIFLMEQSEVEPIVKFLVGLNLATLNPALLKILIIRDVDVNVAMIKDNPQLRAVPALAEFVRLIKNSGSVNGLTDAFVDKVIAEVVAKQPVFPSVKSVSRPQAAQVFVDTQGVFKVDITRLNQSLIAARSEEGQNAAIVAQVKQRLVGSKNNDLTRLLQEVSGDIPSVKLVKEVEAEVASQIERLRDNPKAKAQIAELIRTKLLLSTLETREFQTVIDKVLTAAQLNMQDKYNSLAAMSAQDIEAMDNMRASTDEKMRVRQEMRAKVDKEFEDYFVLAKLVISAIKIEETQLADLNGQLLRLNTTVGGSNDEATLNHLHSTLMAVKQLETEVAARGEQTKQQLAKAFAYVNSLLNDTRRLLNMDDALLAELQQHIESLSRKQTIILSTDTRLKERAALIYTFPGGGFASLFGLISETTDLVINVEATDGTYSEPEMVEAKTRRIMYSAELRETDPDIIMNRGEAIEVRLKRDEIEADRIMAIIDYMSGFYSNVYIVMKVVDSIEEEKYSEIVELFKKNVAKVIYWVSPIEDIMLLVNKYNTESLTYLNVVLRKVVFNKFVLKEHGEKVDVHCVMANLDARTFRIRVPFLQELAKGVVPPKEYIHKLKEIKANL